jgi:short subunit dehydrogenase-like uncharacterized protein
VSGTILIYGATGYTGKLIAKAAADVGARPILAGRPPAVREREIGFSAQSYPDGRINVVARDPRIVWPDGIFADDRCVY